METKSMSNCIICKGNLCICPCCKPVYVTDLRLDQLVERLTEEPKPGNHKDYWLSRIITVCQDEIEEDALEDWCEENLLFWNDPEFNA
jgi:hypothetical protein